MPALDVRFVDPDDVIAQPLIDDLAREYDERYGDIFGEPASAELQRYPSAEFAPPSGAFVVLAEGGEVVAGGAFKRYDATTAELKRIWTHPGHRGRGLGRRVVAELEAEALRRGYTDVYLTTGPRQPEAFRLYLAAGYTPQFDPDRYGEELAAHAFTKSLVTVEVPA
ncbi:GNAT family N-acetyltransferase [Agromyces sp. MMS24-JH15]|uniref:GNAT family N-acetyltransferase n=1 Tax=Agromyces sp. MMS24-JH15 TaxID=3243765 RepID=UPI003747D5CE